MTCIISLLAIIAGRLLEGSETKKTEKGLRLRRRVITAIVFAGIVILARLGLYWIKQPSPLTELSPAQFNMVFETDMRNYFEYDKGIERNLAVLEEFSNELGDDKSRILTADEEKLLRDIWVSIYDYAFALDQINQAVQVAASAEFIRVAIKPDAA